MPGDFSEIKKFLEEKPSIVSMSYRHCRQVNRKTQTNYVQQRFVNPHPEASTNPKALNSEPNPFDDKNLSAIDETKHSKVIQQSCDAVKMRLHRRHPADQPNS